MAARTQLRALADGWLVERRRSGRRGRGRRVVGPPPVPLGARVPRGLARTAGSTRSSATRRSRAAQKISGALGGAVPRLPRRVARRRCRAAARISSLTSTCARRSCFVASGGFGLIATNTVAQGDTREVGLDQLVDDGWTIHRAIASEPWPGGANLEMATVWARRDGWAGSSVLDRREVGGITPGARRAQPRRGQRAPAARQPRPLVHRLVRHSGRDSCFSPRRPRRC